jgi:hypothetical protein
MGTMTAAERLSEQAKTLPESLAVEVLDFMEYLQAKLARKQPNKTTIEAINSDDVEIVTLEELRAMSR